MPGKFLVIEGGDAVGKETQSKMLEEALVAKGKKVAVISFPRYESFFGKLIKEALSGKLGDFRGLHPKLASLPFTLDRVCARFEIELALQHHDYLLCNRYVDSNAAYGMAKLLGEEVSDFLIWLYRAEYAELVGLIRRPDRIILLDTTRAASGGLVWKRGGPSDQYEQDGDYQTRVINTYPVLAETFPEDWRVVKCHVGGTQMRSALAIHQDILRFVLEL